MRSPVSLARTSRLFSSLFAATSLLTAALVLTPGCFLFEGGSCDTHSHCDGNKVVVCLTGEDADGPNTFNESFECPTGTTCTERTEAQPVCVIGEGTPCDTPKAQSCASGIPAACATLSDGKHVLASNLETHYHACDRDEVCQIGADQTPFCVTASLLACEKAGLESCQDGIPSVCVAVAGGKPVWTASRSANADVSKDSPTGCPSGSKCAVVDKSAVCLLDNSAPCNKGDLEICSSANVVSECIQKDDGTWARDALFCKGCDVSGATAEDNVAEDCE